MQGKHLESGQPVRGYEMHLGVSEGADLARPFLEIDGHSDGAVSKSGQVAGCYLHGLFAEDDFRRSYLESLGKGTVGSVSYEAEVEAALEELAAHLEKHLDTDALLRIARAR